jgi:hypothetical protein
MSSGRETAGGDHSIFFISGMHRSGTSYLARALARCGLQLPDPHVEPHEFNERGHWENTRLARVGRKLFGPGDRWYAPVVIRPTVEVLSEMKTVLEHYEARLDSSWGWKDPRIMITFEYWRRLVPAGRRAELVVALRHPLEVARSLEARDGFSIEAGLRLWQRYNDCAIWYMDHGYPTHLFNFNAEDRVSELLRLCRAMRLVPEPASLEHCYEADLHHHRNETPYTLKSHELLLERWQAQKEAFEANSLPANCPSSETPSPSTSHGTSSVRGRTQPEPSQRRPLPGLQLAVLVVRAETPTEGGFEQQLWLRSCLEQIIDFTSAYTDFRVFLPDYWPGDERFDEFLTSVSRHVEVVDCSARDVDRLASSRATLQQLFEYAIASYRIDSIFNFTASSWPIGRAWDVAPLHDLDSDAKLIVLEERAVSDGRDEVCLGIRVSTVQELGLRPWGDPGADLEPGCSSLSNAIVRRYGESSVSVSELASGTGRRDTQDGRPERLLFRRDPAVGFPVDSPRELAHEALYGKRAAEFRIIRDKLRESNSSADFVRLLDMAERSTGSDPTKAHFLLGLVGRHHAFDPHYLEIVCRVLEELGCSAEATAYRRQGWLNERNSYLYQGKHLGPKSSDGASAPPAR